MTKILLDAKALSDLAIEGLLEKKGRNIVRLDLRETEGASTDFFVICTGTSDRHVEALADSVIKVMKEKAEERPLSLEGKEAGEWVLADYFNVVVHIFQEEKRSFYRLEDLWGDGGREEIPESFAA
ncbi:MAG: ribosome silencing factor [Bacteroidota bacterium]